VISASADLTLRVWDLDRSGASCRSVLVGHEDCVNWVAPAPNGRVISGGADGKLFLWDLSSDRPVHEYCGHTAPINSIEIAGKLAFTNSADGTLRVWEAVPGGKCLAAVQAHAAPVIRHLMTPDRRLVVSCADEGAVSIWAWKTGERHSLAAHDDIVQSIDLNGKSQAVTGSHDGTVKLWDLATRQCLGTFSEHTGRVNCVRFTPNGRRVLSASDDGTIRTWDCCPAIPSSPPVPGSPNPPPPPQAPVSSVQAARPSSASRFDVFLCHNSKDKPSVRILYKQLTDVGVLPWFDEEHLIPGRAWQDELQATIPRIRTAAVIVGPNGQGPWQQMELRALLSEFVSRGCPIIPVLLRGAPPRVELPPFLREFTWVDFRRDDPASMTRLVWGITGVRPAS
jgi:hypothetical protein